MKLEPKALAPLAVLTVGLVCTTALIAVNPRPEPREVSDRHPLVRIVTAERSEVKTWVHTAGTVTPRIDSELVAEVSGRVAAVAEALEPGEFFEAGQVLLQIEPRDYETALERARASLERATSQLQLADKSLVRMKGLRSRGASSSAKFEEAESNARIAAANLRDAKAQVSQAELDLERTQVRAPFGGRVRTRIAEVGQFVGRGASLAAIFSTDAAEVRLPVPARELAFLDVGVSAPAKQADDAGLVTRGLGEMGMPAPSKRRPKVILTAELGGLQGEWSGEIVRVEGALDTQTRMLHVVARITDPQARTDGPPLAMGLFVDAQIEGRPLADVIELPRAALRPGDEVLVVDDEMRLRRRKVEIMRTESERVWIASGLEAGERVCATPPAVVVDGMRVRVQPSPAAAPAPGSADS